jgi:hypothetical protein
VTLKEALTHLAEQHNITFMPHPKRGPKDGKPVFAFGHLSVYLDRSVIFVLEAPTDPGRAPAWKPIALDDLIERAADK